MHTIINYYKNSLMYVLSVCSALQFPAPTADIALTLTLYSVPAGSGTMSEFWEGEMVRSLSQEVVPCILYWRWYWEMGSSLCGVVQFARKAGNPDDTALDRDRPVTWEGTSETDRRNYVKFRYHWGTIHAVMLFIVTHETQAGWHVHCMLPSSHSAGWRISMLRIAHNIMTYFLQLPAGVLLHAALGRICT